MAPDYAGRAGGGAGPGRVRLWRSGAPFAVVRQGGSVTNRTTPLPRGRLGPRERALRAAVVALRREHRGWTFPPRIRVGELGGDHVEVELERGHQPDHALIADMTDALVERALVAGALPRQRLGDGWVLRPGPPVDDAADRSWLREIARAVELRGLRRPRLWVVTKAGGTDVTNGRTRTWVRARLS